MRCLFDLKSISIAHMGYFLMLESQARTKNGQERVRFSVFSYLSWENDEKSFPSSKNREKDGNINMGVLLSEEF